MSIFLKPIEMALLIIAIMYLSIFLCQRIDVLFKEFPMRGSLIPGSRDKKFLYFQDYWASIGLFGFIFPLVLFFFIISEGEIEQWKRGVFLLSWATLFVLFVLGGILFNKRPSFIFKTISNLSLTGIIYTVFLSFFTTVIGSIMYSAWRGTVVFPSGLVVTSILGVVLFIITTLMDWRRGKFGL